MLIVARRSQLSHVVVIREYTKRDRDKMLWCYENLTYADLLAAREWFIDS